MRLRWSQFMRVFAEAALICLRPVIDFNKFLGISSLVINGWTLL